MPVENPPIGTIMAYSGPIDSPWEKANGWLVCDGRSLDRTSREYQQLFDNIGSSWGGDGVNKFNIPDLKGMFLRGVSDGSNRDPDADSRTASQPGGHAGNKVGSVQPQEVHAHGHQITVYRDPRNNYRAAFSGAGYDKAEDFANGSTYVVGTSGYGGNETRPMNAYVHWIIRYK